VVLPPAPPHAATRHSAAIEKALFINLFQILFQKQLCHHPLFTQSKPAKHWLISTNLLVTAKLEWKAAEIGIQMWQN
jgi:hypothetical protein